MASHGNMFGGSLTFDHRTQEWAIFKSRLGQFCTANDINEVTDKSSAKRRAILLTALAEDTYRVARSLLFPADIGTVEYATLIKHFDTHFESKKSSFVERYKFYKAEQRAGEDLAEWATRVRSLAEYCGFKAELDIMLRDRFVLGLEDVKEKEKLFAQNVDTLTFNRALELAQSVRCARQALNAAGPATAAAAPAPVYAMRGGSGAPPPTPPRPAGMLDSRCEVCGYKNHSKDQCRFVNFTCSKCKIKGHLKRMCTSKSKYRSNHFLTADDDDTITVPPSDPRHYVQRKVLVKAFKMNPNSIALLVFVDEFRSHLPVPPSDPRHHVQVGCEISSDLSLLEYLRVYNEVRGTKYMCREGGCGACVVVAARPGERQHAVNSCLVSVTSCQDWEISTIEDVGNRLKGYHPLQKTLAKLNGTQCGYCSPGWVMAMYGLLQSKEKLTMLEIEQSLGSNICRCTGYRPILEAFKKFASDAPEDDILDIEDLSICEKSGETCRKSKCSESDWCLVEAKDVKLPERIEIQLKDGKSWSRVQSVVDIFEVLRRMGDDCYMLVAGNTAKGAYPIHEFPRVLIDISNVQELKGYHIDQNLVLGAGNTLTDAMEIFHNMAATLDSFWYLEKLREHLKLVAHIPVRNLGTIAGNLMIKHQHNEFQSDVFLLLEAVGAYLTIVDHYGVHVAVTPEAFLQLDMRGKVILNVLLPPLSHAYKFVSFKIMPRAQNAHAIVNAAFLYKLCAPQDHVCVARIVYGGLSPNFVHAKNTERFLLGRQLFSNDNLQSAIKVLLQELVVVDMPPEPSAKYRRDLAVNLFYKGLLSICPGNIVSPRYASGGIVLSKTRPVSDGRQIFTTNPVEWPITQPIEKVEALIQCAGEAPYTEDLPALPREVFGAYVLTKVPLGEIDQIDASEALHHPGVLAFYSAKDIPGVNSFVPGDNPFFVALEEIFCAGPVRYNGQVVGVLVAETRTIAEYAVKLVHVKYKNVKKPVIDIKKAKKDTNRTKMAQAIPATSKGSDITKVIKGEETIYQQIHFCMETLESVAKPTEEGLEVHCTSQHMDGVQYMISRVLKLPEHKIDVYVRRLGGAYGIKISRGNQTAIISALVTHKLNRPCRVLLPFPTQNQAVGKRLPCSTDYEVAVDATGRIQYCNENLYMDNGYVLSEPLFLATLDVYNNCYDKSRFDYKVFNVLTDTASNTWCRAPGTLEAIASAEFILERIAYELSQDPLEVRLRNLDPAYERDMKEQVDRIKIEAQYDDRKAAVDKFNSQNRWKKRGLRFSLLRWQPFGGQYFDITLSVYQDDGTVSITHGGIEMGQGLNTKAVQIAAYFLGISIDKIQIKGNNTIINPNGFISGGSLTSINIGIGVQRCCEELLIRLAPVRKDNPNATWEALVKAAFNANVDLQTHGFVSMADTQKVNVFGVTLAEVEVDILTGEWEFIRVDILEDAGQSLSPEIDIGQVEGAFIMGLGYWTYEHLVYDPRTGELLTDRTWNYHVPQARDIPVDFRVYFRNNSYSEPRILGAKSIGEPPICMAVAVPFALREAMVSARSDAGLPSNQWFQIDGPYTREAIQQNTATKFSDFKFY